MAKPKVSVIVPIYKVQNYLMQCIDSILSQTLQEIEVILVDEGDIDECRAIIDMYEFGPKKDSRIKTLHEKNGGYGASVNKGFDIATGEYISIIESDDFIAPEMYEEIYNYAKSFDADVVKMPYYEYWDNTSSSSEIIKICSDIKKTKFIPEKTTFSIMEYPILVSIHPSIWAGLYKTDYIRQKNIRCIEARGAGYVDNHFRLQTMCQTNKILWLNKPFNYYRLSNPDASQANYDLGAFIQRWADVHKLFKEKFPEKWDKLASWCIIEEWVNTYFRITREGYKLTKEQADLLISNLSNISKDQIIKSEGLKDIDKKVLLKFKSEPNKFYKFVNQNAKEINLKTQKTKSKTKIKFCGLTIFKILENLESKKIYLLGILPIIKISKKI